jgi:hypothetical protein
MAASQREHREGYPTTTLWQAGAGNKKWSQLWTGPRCDVAEPDDLIGGGIKQIARGPVLGPPYARPTDSTVLWDT